MIARVVASTSLSRAFAVLFVAGLLAAPPALAGGAPSSPFEQSGGKADGAGASAQQRRPGTLPFTGIDLLVVSGVALVLTGAGLALRRAAVVDPDGP